MEKIEDKTDLQAPLPLPGLVHESGEVVLGQVPRVASQQRVYAVQQTQYIVADDLPMGSLSLLLSVCAQ
jgi:hypothetical protein